MAHGKEKVLYENKTHICNVCENVDKLGIYYPNVADMVPQYSSGKVGW